MKSVNEHNKFISFLNKTNSIIDDENYDELDTKGFTVLNTDKIFWEKNKLDFNLIEKEFDYLCSSEGLEGGWENKKKAGVNWEPSAQRVSNLPNKNRIFLKLAMLSDILLGVNYVIKKPFKFSSMQIRNPVPFGDCQSLHIDFRPRQFKYFNYNQCSAFIYLDNADKDNGALNIYPGTHKILGEPSQNFIEANHLEPTVVNVKKFNIVLLNIYTWHFGGKNFNGKKRRTIFINFRERSELQQLDQKRFLSREVMNEMSDNEKYLFAVRNEDPVQSVFETENRNNFLIKKYMKIKDIFYHKYLQYMK